MALLIHVGSHPDELVDKVCRLLASPPADPFTPEMVAVPTRGIERWLSQRIASESKYRSSGDGICANVQFPSPRRLVQEALMAVPETASALDAWEGPGFTRTVMSVVDEHIDEPWMWLLARFVDPGGRVEVLDNSQRLRAALKIGGLYTRYARRRPEMLRAWRDGRDLGPGGDPLPDTDIWQPRLWRRVRDRIATPSLAELLPGALDPIRRGEVDLALPERVLVYGLTAADPMDLEVFGAIAPGRDVHIYVLHPSPILWEETAALLDGSPPIPGPARESDPALRLPRHPILRSWAQESRELQLVFAGWNHAGDASLAGTGGEGRTLLARLQRDIRSNRPPEREAASSDTKNRDRSVQIHVCHGARRQVEVLRDAILHVLAADRSLEPRDVVIMTPDLAVFAPLLEAVFLRDVAYDQPGPALDTGVSNNGEGLPDLRLRIADRAPAATNPLVRFASTVLDLARSRLEGGAVRELVSMPVVRQLFGLDEETADGIAALTEDTNVRWGIDSEHRSWWDAGGVEDYTWRRGLDRALAGVFYEDSSVRVIETVAPLNGVEGEEARLVGVLAQIIDRIGAVREILGHPMPYSQWGPAIATAVRLLAAPDWAEQWQWGQLERLLAESFPAGEDDSDEPMLGSAEALLVVDGWSRAVPSPLHFRTGDITVCTLAPMRSVPYRVVCLLGMDDERFPRDSRNDGDDLLVDHVIIGDSDRGAEDRQLLLDAVMAARDHLIVTYSGRDELTNAEYPPAVPISELRDVLADMVGADNLKRIETHHPLQAFSESNFVDDGLGLEGPWGFDPLPFAGSLALRQRTVQAPNPLSLPPPDEDFFSEIQLDDLRRFLEHPAAGFIRTRLGFVIPSRRETPDDTIPTDLDALSEWKTADRLLAGLLSDYPMALLEARERAGDNLPPGNLGRKRFTNARQRAVGLSDAARQVGYDAERHEQFTGTVRLRRCVVEGSITADPGSNRAMMVTPSRLKGKHRLRAFINLVFLSALEPHRPWHGLLIGRHFKGDNLWIVQIGPLRGDEGTRRNEAKRLLSGLVDLYVEGLTSPIPLPCETAFTWQRNLGNGRKSAAGKAGVVWEKDRFSPEAEDPANQFLFPKLATMSALESSLFPSYAKRLWGPILPLLREKAAQGDD